MGKGCGVYSIDGAAIRLSRNVNSIRVNFAPMAIGRSYFGKAASAGFVPGASGDRAVFMIIDR